MNTVQVADRLMSAPELAASLEISARALRFYETKGLIDPERVGNNRVYRHKDFVRLQLILRGKRLGFSLAEISEFLDLYDADPHHTNQLRLLLDKVNQRILQLQQQKSDLEQTLSELIEIQQSASQELTLQKKS